MMYIAGTSSQPPNDALRASNGALDGRESTLGRFASGFPFTRCLESAEMPLPVAQRPEEASRQKTQMHLFCFLAFFLVANTHTLHRPIGRCEPEAQLILCKFTGTLFSSFSHFYSSFLSVFYRFSLEFSLLAQFWLFFGVLSLLRLTAPVANIARA